MTPPLSVLPTNQRADSRLDIPNGRDITIGLVADWWACFGMNAAIHKTRGATVYLFYRLKIKM